VQSSQAKLPDWYRGLAVVVGLISIALAFVVLLDPLLGIATLVLLLGFALLVMGIDRVIAGVTGHPFGLMTGGARETVKEVTGMGESPPAGSQPPR
jgi:hypothetical protein